MSPPHCHPGREGVGLCVCPCPQPQPAEGLLTAHPFHHTPSDSLPQARKTGCQSQAQPCSPQGWHFTQPVLGTVMPLTGLWVPLGEEGHMGSPTPPAVSTKGKSKERGININQLICTERLSLIPQPDSTQKEG